MTNLQADASSRCANGHEVGPGQAFCPSCGARVATHQTPTPPGWYPDQTNPTMVRWWDGAAWTEQVRPRDQRPQASSKGRLPLLLALAGAGFLVLLVAIGAMVAASRNDHGGSDAQRSGSSTPTSAMFDPAASQKDVISSIRHDFCASGDSSPSDSGAGYVFISCGGPNGSALFQVFDSPDALQLALNSGVVKCMQGETAVIGPTWAANLVNATDAADLVAQGATSGSCN